VHAFREHAASIKAFRALFSADLNGTNCNPGEAVFLLYLLMSDDGVLYERNLDSAQDLMQPYNQQSGKRGGVAVFHMETLGSSANGLLSSYSLNHNRNTIDLLFDNTARTLGF
jgi:hypothetical protein